MPTSAHINTTPPTPSPWLWFVPVFAFILFFAAVGGVLWFNEKAEKEEAHAKLISDMLWLEQSLRFVFDRHAAILAAMTPQQTATTAAFEAQIGLLTASKEGLQAALWYDTAHQPQRIYPGLLETWRVRTSDITEATADAQKLARSIGRSVFTKPYLASGGDWQFEMHVPVFHNGHLSGFASAVYSLKRLLTDSVPWWLAERYSLRITDATGKTLMARSNVPHDDLGNTSYEASFDPPGFGLSLGLHPYPQTTTLAARLLPASFLLLAALVLWSLWSLRRHARQRLAAEAALNKEHAFRKAMENSLPTGMRALGNDGCITYVNPAFCRMVGYSETELLGSHAPQPYWPLDQRDSIATALAAARNGNIPPQTGVEMQLQRKNGERFDALLFETPLIDETGRQVGWMGSLLDITRRKRARDLARQQEERLAATARLVTMGEMASSIAHELNQPLAAIASYNAGCAKMITTPDADLSEISAVLEKSAEQARRAGSIIRRIYEFVRRSEPKSEPCNLEDTLIETLNLAQPYAERHRIIIHRDWAQNLPLIEVDRVLLVQALLNLVRNAIDATVQAGETQNAPGTITMSAQREEGYVRIAIIDSGIGISAEAEKHIFDPFYTTKQEGMGMGLNICRSIIEAHHGRLTFSRNTTQGVSFQVRLPMQEVTC